MNTLKSTRTLPSAFNNYRIYHQLKCSINQYITPEYLTKRLEDLPIQFKTPKPRPWKPINLENINSRQILGIDLEVFIAILIGSINTEAPIRHYTQTSRQYLEPWYPQLAKFVGGKIAKNGQLIELGLWEKEEQRHTPVLMKVYTQLTGEKVKPNPHKARHYQPFLDSYHGLYHHGFHRVATEYGATCLYLWLMVHTTGELRAILEELVIDEINHMTKFLGFGIWAFPESNFLKIGETILKSMKGKLSYDPQQSSLMGTLNRMTEVLSWSTWSWQNRLSFMFTCTYIFYRLWGWTNQLTPAYLESLLGKPLSKDVFNESYLDK
ncbi:ferritin-like domain-containing protein [Crocosphaera subtropica]|nr:ferritin-like domain-containing protein [Crocosphaera subtropica]